MGVITYRRSLTRHTVRLLCATLLCLPSWALADSRFKFLDAFNFDNDDLITEQPIDLPHQVNDLAYGDVLYAYFQQRYASAIAKILIAREKGLLEQNKEHSDLLLGALYVSYGMLDKGEVLFKELLNNSHITKAGADEAWYQLARIYYRKGNYPRALEILYSHIQQPLDQRNTEHLLLQVLCHIRQGEVERARALSGYLKSDASLSLFIQFNLGSAFAQLGEYDKAAKYYRYVVKKSRSNDDLELALRDQSALALGVYYIRKGDLFSAEETLEQIRLFGPVSNKALLAMGWTHFNAKQKIDALTPWVELSGRDLTDPAVQESNLNVPYVYETMGALQDALEGYEKAYNDFQNQTDNLETVKSAILSDDWIQKISPIDTTNKSILSSIEAFSLPINNVETPHIYPYFASNNFQNLYREYRELQKLYLTLKHWEQQFPAFEGMIATHIRRLNELAPKADVTLAESQQFLSQTQEKMASIEARLNEVNTEGNNALLANPKQREYQTRLASLEATLTRMQDEELHRDISPRVRLLKGVLQWEMHKSGIDGQWNAQKDKIEIHNLLLEMEQRLTTVAQARQVRIKRFQGFESRISQLESRVNGLQADAANALRKHRQLMQKMAVSIVEQQQQQLSIMKAKTLLSIARLQDLAYMKERERKLIQSQQPITPDTESESLAPPIEDSAQETSLPEAVAPDSTVPTNTPNTSTPVNTTP